MEARSDKGLAQGFGKADAYDKSCSSYCHI